MESRGGENVRTVASTEDGTSSLADTSFFEGQVGSDTDTVFFSWDPVQI